MTLIYIANGRMPTEKAHGYQIVQMCEAFALKGGKVTLVMPRRINDQPDLQGVQDIWAYYGVRQNFRLVYLPCLDLIWRFDTRWAFLLQTFTFILSLLLWLPFQKANHLFSRDPFIMAALTLIASRQRLIYEVHHKFRSRRGQRLQAWLLRRVGRVVSLTATMAAQLQTMGARDVIVAHDGIRPESGLPAFTQSEARRPLNIPEGAFVACYAGRLHTMGMSKGLDVFVGATAQVREIWFLLVGGPAEEVATLRQAWNAYDLPPEQFIAVGTVPPTQVPRYLAAADICLITSPKNEFFANETSPMKLFEYMLAERAIVASDLPSTREVVQHGHSAYLVPPSDVDALAAALRILRDDPALQRRLAHQARQDVMAYTWQARAERILADLPQT